MAVNSGNDNDNDNELSFHIVDVFAQTKYAGNQLAVVRDADTLTDNEMLTIAREFDYSETTFIEGGSQQGYDVRIFTPEEEVPFAGHPTLGTAKILMDEYADDSNGNGVRLNLPVGSIPVEDDDGVLWMEQEEPEFGATFDGSRVADVLGISADEIDEKCPIQAVSTGLPAVIVPLQTLDAVKRCEINRAEYEAFIDGNGAKIIFVFASETYDANDLNARMFAPYYGVPEDPATGSSNGCLAGYLVKHSYFNEEEIEVTVEQGYEIDRPSLLYLRAKKNGNEIEVSVGGEVVRVADGELV
ncbi:MAG: PhzF family phenazine biosynthesis protein [Halobacteria archaeon]|nr:PhzF family phenazine biosynthesis protein [Halobacteria archaeon]